MTIGTGVIGFEGDHMEVDDVATVRLDLPKAALNLGETIDADFTVFILADAHKGSVSAGDQVLVTSHATIGDHDNILYFDDLGTLGRLTCFDDTTNNKVAITGTEPNFNPGVIESYASRFIASGFQVGDDQEHER